MEYKILLLEMAMESEIFYMIPGSLSSANDQLDKGPVMFRTATQTSSNELKEKNMKAVRPFS